ncbi:DNA mismatch repair protein MutS [Heyndrickxia sporothermodurans]|uniref:DNA mismatch repair protein MutS n=2 Tax=Heyndrickxia sporothermodurans TaxID=46224 RepID=A0AB37HB18_9BACI|nr:DNA mismatch repair protein MutS [Heyndrickxia sporothermodurans]MBL5768822.1 DNA mismatch repair protein MutS [Heyndrickxia sporothermodurans]MBL5772568.1 DNA mismatch repair protein MutS [Heyndrickxia sporothermodurans]MBL5776080.1 DNA mismatch repair protein MutS [Heyndrickxia sporothermodurans]MBL5779604.1 DNA mismatch repair protein MutS [Heyndrickxia sporothermodurans]MBL5783151.1 DNA mismatch repair protein MutS [Heyndrickxia sporothermodurans]
MGQYTPMIQQYLQVKADYKDAFLFFRLGDFYEMFFEDALKASQELEITLTSRDGGGNERIPMCGVPYHAAANYIDVLIEKGHKVAICEQVEDPKQSKGVVRREVVQLITPGTKMEGKGLREKENNYIAAISTFEDGYGIAYTDLSTGENSVTIIENHFDLVLNELSIIGAKEVVVQSQFKDHLQKQLQERLNATISIEDDISEKPDYRKLLSTINEHSMRISIIRLFNYLYRTQKRNLDHLQPVAIVEINQFLKIDYYSKRNLEITETIRSKGKKGSLLWLLDETMTAMGGRLLKHWLDRPLINQKEIEQRQLVVETFIEHFFERQDIREKLKEVYDLERLAGRVAFGNVNARDLIQLKSSLQQIPIIRQLIEQLELDFVEQLDPCEELVDVLERAIIDNPPLSIKEGGIIKDGYNEELDKYRDASRNGKNWLAQLEQEERSRTGIKSLKIGYNRVFGYFIEVTKSNLHLLEEGRYDRKQTLANAERFITPELKEKESLILQAEEKSVELEYELFLQIREVVKEYIPRLQNLAKIVSEIDVLQCFATISESRHYVKPLFNSERKVIIKEGRHPVVEKVMNAQEYVPNDCYMDAERELLLITGPNMSGKSTYMRQIALTSILAQIGCFVPAREAILPIFDQVFTRIGAADDLISGQSTFMVEMLEAKNAIANATKNSLILFDEIGRGTSTYDGMALAQAIIEYIHTQIGAKTLFSTHYHELTVLAETLPQLKNVHVSAIEQNGTVVFLHKIKEGPADKSYGIHVAELAELPKELIVRANEILRQLENQNNKHEQVAPKKEEHSLKQLSLFEETDTKVKKEITSKEKKIVEELKDINLLELNPLQAMNTLYELQKKLKG